MFHLPVLVVDDVPQLRLLVRAVLTKRGFQVLEASDGANALTTVEESAGGVSLIITDFHMPRLNGGQLAQLVKARFPTIPILLISTDTCESDYSSVDAFLAKPFMPSALVHTVHRLMQQCA